MILRVGQREKKEDLSDKGERLAILSVCTDMSRFVQRQKELEAKDALSDYLFKNLPGGHVRCSTEEGLPFFMGFSVDRAEDGIFCVDELEKAPDGAYDRMLVDIQMPNMDGYKATKIIRRLPEEESGYPHPRHDGQCLCNGSEKGVGNGDERPHCKTHQRGKDSGCTGTHLDGKGNKRVRNCARKSRKPPEGGFFKREGRNRS